MDIRTTWTKSREHDTSCKRQEQRLHSPVENAVGSCWGTLDGKDSVKTPGYRMRLRCCQAANCSSPGPRNLHKTAEESGHRVVRYVVPFPGLWRLCWISRKKAHGMLLTIQSWREEHRSSQRTPVGEIIDLSLGYMQMRHVVSSNFLWRINPYNEKAVHSEFQVFTPPLPAHRTWY